MSAPLTTLNVFSCSTAAAAATTHNQPFSTSLRLPQIARSFTFAERILEHCAWIIDRSNRSYRYAGRHASSNITKMIMAHTEARADTIGRDSKRGQWDDERQVRLSERRRKRDHPAAGSLPWLRRFFASAAVVLTARGTPSSLLGLICIATSTFHLSFHAIFFSRTAHGDAFRRNRLRLSAFGNAFRLLKSLRAGGASYCSKY